MKIRILKSFLPFCFRLGENRAVNLGEEVHLTDIQSKRIKVCVLNENGENEITMFRQNMFIYY